MRRGDALLLTRNAKIEQQARDDENLTTERPTFVTHLECSVTGERYPADELHNLSRAGKPLLVRHLATISEHTRYIQSVERAVNTQGSAFLQFATVVLLALIAWRIW